MQLHVLVFFVALSGQPEFLRGPAVEDNDEPGIVSRSMTGRFIEVEGRPEAAAFESLPIGSERRAAAADLVQKRINRLALALIDEIDLVKEMTDDITAGRTEAANRRRQALREQLDPGSPRDPLLPELLELLETEQERSMLTTAVAEYWEAWITEALRERELDTADPDLRSRAQEQLSNRLFQRDLAAAYEVSLQRYRQAMDAMYSAIQPTPKQRERIRELVIEHIKATRLEATPEQRREVMLKIYRELDADRQERLFEYMTEVALR